MPSGDRANIIAVDALLVPWPNGETITVHAGSRSSDVSTFGSIGGNDIILEGWKPHTD